MKAPMLPLAALLAGLPAVPALAQASLPRERWQVGIGFNAQESVQEDYLNGTNQYLRYNRKDSGAPALLLRYRALDLEASHLSLTSEYQFWSRAAGFSDLATDAGSRRMLRALDANTESALQVGVRF